MYRESEDTMLLILREIYQNLGVHPDCSVPQNTMTVQRTKILTQNVSEISNYVWNKMKIPLVYRIL